MIKVIDYGMGNVQAFLNVYKRLNISAEAAKDSANLEGASHLILPGVGSFDHALELLQQSEMRDTLDELVLKQNVPILGVCVGMQIMAMNSEEGRLDGLRWVRGSVRKLDNTSHSKPLRLPHMGWNDVSPLKPSKLFTGLEEEARFYFLHSYHFVCDSPDSALADCEYGHKFVCAVHSNNIYGVQFHPEKSHQYGNRLLKNFAEL